MSESQFKGFYGQELKVGDVIACPVSSSHIVYMRVGTIIELLETGIKLQWECLERTMYWDRARSKYNDGEVKKVTKKSIVFNWRNAITLPKNTSTMSDADQPRLRFVYGK